MTQQFNFAQAEAKYTQNLLSDTWSIYLGLSGNIDFYGPDYSFSSNYHYNNNRRLILRANYDIPFEVEINKKVYKARNGILILNDIPEEISILPLPQEEYDPQQYDPQQREKIYLKLPEKKSYFYKIKYNKIIEMDGETGQDGELIEVWQGENKIAETYTRFGGYYYFRLPEPEECYLIKHEDKILQKQCRHRPALLKFK